VYQGQLLVRQRDYAVLRYEALWQLDTVTYNATARKNAGRQTPVARLYSQAFSADRSTHTVDYAKGPNGRYYAHRSIGQSQRAGRTLGSKQSFYYQMLVEQFLQPLPEAGPAPATAPAPKPKSKGALSAPVEVPYRPEFWAGYRRPGGPLSGSVGQP
jgi:hypothetical protein